MASKIDICQRAASATGNGPLVSLDDGSDVAAVIDQHYDGLVESMLTQHAWKFARRVSALTLLTTVPEVPWTAVYQLPTDCLSLHFIANNWGFRVDHEERDDPSGKAVATMLLPTACVTAIFATYTARVSEDRFPADFAKALQYRMEAVFLSAIAEQRDASGARESAAEMLERKARVRDQRASTPTDPDEWDLTAARRRSTAWGAWRSRGAL